MSPTPSNTTYRNWGTYNGIFNSQPGLNVTEPNNYDYMPECVAPPACARHSALQQQGWHSALWPCQQWMLCLYLSEPLARCRYCATADYFEATTKPAGQPWGWNDQNCILKYAFMCKYWPRECPGCCGWVQQWEGRPTCGASAACWLRPSCLRAAAAASQAMPSSWI